jgi:CheY-like chemotaxis protein
MESILLLLSPVFHSRPALRVLVVEDDPGLRAVYKAALTVAGFLVVAVEDGVDALQYIERHTPAAIVLDLALPRLSGRDVQRELAAAPLTRHVPIVVVTGSDAADLDESKFACVLRKPVDPETLVEQVERCTQRSRGPQPAY